MILEVTNQMMPHFIMIKMTKTILMLESLNDESLNTLNSNSEIKVIKAYDSSTDLSEINYNIVDAIITRGLGKVNVELMDKCANLKIAARCGVGLDNVDIAEATKRGIKILNIPGANANTVAEHTIALILMMQRNLFEAVNEVKKGNWASRNTFKSDELNTKTIGILGLGNIGLKVGKIAEILGMKVVYWDISSKEVSYTFLSKEEIFKTADVISLHLPLFAETENIINAQSISIMKPNVFIVNTARKPLVNYEDITTALYDNKIAGYAADVPNQPAPTAKDPLVSHPKSLITAHVSSLTATTFLQMCEVTVNNVLALLTGNKPKEGCIFNETALKTR